MLTGDPPPELRLRLPSPTEELHDDRIERYGVRLFLKRDDLIHPEIPGNKWRKLKYNLAAARERGHRTLLTFGGAYSNHIRATAAAGYYCGFDTVGVIRGEEHDPPNASLAYAADRGMKLTYLDRAVYRKKTDPAVVTALQRQFGDFYLLPEGGTNQLAVHGCAELAAEIDTDFDVVCCPCGTGGTLAGLAAGLAPGQQAIGFSVLRGGAFLVEEVARLQEVALGQRFDNWRLELDFHGGGFARSTTELDGFAADFAARHAIALDRVYVAKMMYGLYARVAAGEFPPGTTVVAVLTG